MSVGKGKHDKTSSHFVAISVLPKSDKSGEQVSEKGSP